MRWFKVAAIAVGILIAFLVAGTVVGFIIHAVMDLVIAALVVGAIVVAIKVARSGKRIEGKHRDREVRDEDHSKPLPRADVEHVSTSYTPPPSRPNTQDVDDELARLKREMGG